MDSTKQEKIVTSEEKIKQAIKLGNVHIDPDKADTLSRMKINSKSDFTITFVEMTCGKTEAGRWINFDWETQSAGFGSTVFYVHTNGYVEIENECMGKNFIKSVLLACEDETIKKELLELLDKAKLRDEPPK
jgi:hypothetical protein